MALEKFNINPSSQSEKILPCLTLRKKKKLFPFDFEKVNYQTSMNKRHLSTYPEVLTSLGSFKVYPCCRRGFPPSIGIFTLELGEISTQLSALGNNINQMAKVLNTANQQGQLLPSNLNHVEDLTEIMAVIDQLKPTLKQIRLELSGVESSEQ